MRVFVFVEIDFNKSKRKKIHLKLPSFAFKTNILKFYSVHFDNLYVFNKSLIETSKDLRILILELNRF